jgi:cytochrome P450
MQERLLAETYYVIEQATKAGLVENLTSELVENFNFTRNCWFESLRLVPPTSVSGAACFSEDTTIGKVRIEKDLGFIVSMFAMHMDPTEWINPEAFLPDRFDPTHALSLRPDGSKRNPQTFNPFLGGKRVCLGKSFAEITTRLTLPLLYYHFDFKFADESKGVINYHMGQPKTPVINFNFTVKNIPN